MNLQQARRTLGITPEDDKAAIKKKYRHLMGQFHPDAQVGENALDSIRRAQEINEAYEYLKKQAYRLRHWNAECLEGQTAEESGMDRQDQ